MGDIRVGEERSSLRLLRCGVRCRALVAALVLSLSGASCSDTSDGAPSSEELVWNAGDSCESYRGVIRSILEGESFESQVVLIDKWLASYRGSGANLAAARAELRAAIDEAESIGHIDLNGEARLQRLVIASSGVDPSKDLNEDGFQAPVALQLTINSCEIVVESSLPYLETALEAVSPFVEARHQVNLAEGDLAAELARFVRLTGMAPIASVAVAALSDAVRALPPEESKSLWGLASEELRATYEDADLFFVPPPDG